MRCIPFLSHARLRFALFHSSDSRQRLGLGSVDPSPNKVSSWSRHRLYHALSQPPRPVGNAICTQLQPSREGRLNLIPEWIFNINTTPTNQYKKNPKHITSPPHWFFFGYISVLKYTHFFKKMGILQMGIFPIFLKNGYIFQICMPKKVLLLKNNTIRF